MKSFDVILRNKFTGSILTTKLSANSHDEVRGKVYRTKPEHNIVAVYPSDILDDINLKMEVNC